MNVFTMCMQTLSITSPMVYPSYKREQNHG